MNKIVTGTTVRIVRTTAEGKTKFVKSGTVGEVTAGSFEFTENLNSPFPGKRVYVVTDDRLPEIMSGWSQTTTLIEG